MWIKYGLKYVNFLTYCVHYVCPIFSHLSLNILSILRIVREERLGFWQYILKHLM
jgi:hypothetical protein